jgi:hypothetical protein
VACRRVWPGVEWGAVGGRLGPGCGTHGRS